MKPGDLVKMHPDTLHMLHEGQLRSIYANRVGIVLSILQSTVDESVQSANVLWHNDPEPECEYCDGLILINEA